MLRTTMLASGSLANTFSGILTVLPNSVCVQCVRWRRKPRWLPVAKSKVFRIPEKPKIPDDERIELQRLHNNYKTMVRSIRRHIRESVGESVISVDMALKKTEEEEDFLRCLELNNKWNESVAKEREIRLEKERQVRREQILQKIIAKEQRDLENLENVEENVRRIKKESVNFITPKNIDQAIEDALANPVDHNWAIDNTGTIHHGKYVKPEADNNKKQRAQQNL